MPIRARIFVGLFAATLVGLFGPTLIAVAYHSGSGSGSISGTVVSAETGDPLRRDDFCVSAWFARDSQFTTDKIFTGDEIFAGSTKVLDDGSYAVRNLPLDSYKVEFHPCSSGRIGGVRTNHSIAQYLPEFWNDARTYDDATAIAVGPSQRVTGIDAAIDEIF